MTGQIIGIVIIGTLVMLAAVEVRRYARAGDGADELPYPRRRLSRRIAISLIFSLMVGLVSFWPNGAPPWLQMVLLLLVTLGIPVGLTLIWRDLRETSQAALDQAATLQAQASASLREALRPPDK